MEQNKNFWQKNKMLVIIVLVVVIIVFWFVGKYNYFITQNENIDASWAQVENQLQRRFDLIPNLVNVVKGISQQEKDVFGALADARARYAGASSVDEKAKLAGQVESSLARLLMVVENYPQLLSSQSYRDLSVQLEGTENRIAVERMKFNDEVKVFNASVKRFPNSIIASLFGFVDRSYFEISEGVEVVPKVDFKE